MSDVGSIGFAPGTTILDRHKESMDGALVSSEHEKFRAARDRIQSPGKSALTAKKCHSEVR